MKFGSPRVHRLVLLTVALVAVSYIRVQHRAVNSHGDNEKSPAATRRLAQRSALDPVEAAVGVEAPVHGFVHKAGMTALANWHPAYVPLRTSQFKSWLEHKGSVLQGAGPAGLNLLGVKPPYILPFHDGRGCNIYYNERYKVIFLRTQKVASTTTMTFFGECAKDPATATQPDSPSCLKPLDLEDALQLQLTWKNYFVFGWTRNPWSRAVSSYQYLLHAVKDRPQCDKVDWDTFCADPLVFGELCKAQPDCCPIFNHNFMFFHVNDQTTCLTTDSGEWAADFIGRSERFDEDFPVIVAAINQRLAPGVEPLSIKAKPPSQNTNEVRCSDELQPRRKSPDKDPAGEATSSSQPVAAQNQTSTDSAAGQAAAADTQPAGAVEAQQSKSGDAAAATGAGQAAEAAAAGAVGIEPAAGAQQAEQTAGAESQQVAQEGGQQGGEGQGGKRRLLYGALPGFLFAAENYCDKRKFYMGQHEACFHQVARFYGGDVQRLGFQQLLADGQGRDTAALAVSQQ
ncbi:hypothetical protein N2152v2_001889 [Parachlorella kessleri]